MRQVERGLAYEHRGDGRIGGTRFAPRAGGERQHMGNKAFAVACGQRHGDTFDADRRITDRRICKTVL